MRESWRLELEARALVGGMNWRRRGVPVPPVVHHHTSMSSQVEKKYHPEGWRTEEIISSDKEGQGSLNLNKTKTYKRSLLATKK